MVGALGADLGRKTLDASFATAPHLGGVEHILICPLLQNTIFSALNQRHLYITLETIWFQRTR